MDEQQGFQEIELTPPLALTTAVFHLEPLTASHLDRDYDAVMTSAELLRSWGGHGWPEPEFTRAENLADLQRHDYEHQQHLAFTYTVLTPDKHRCLGCLYITPSLELLAENPHLQTAVSPHIALLRFWIRQEELPNQLDAALLTTLQAWFQSSAWAFEQVYLHTPVAHQPQVTLFAQAGLPVRHTASMPERGGDHYLYALL